jgi:uncharacterized protein
MRMPKLRLAALALAICLCGLIARPALAQQPAPPTADALKVAEVLLQTMGMEKQFEAVVPMMMGQMRQVIVQANPAAVKDIDQVMQAMTAKFSSRKSEVIPLAAQVYARRLSIDDMKAMTAFFKTPAGLRFVETMPQLTQESMMIGQQWGMKLGQEVERELREELSKRGLKL